jgi:CheY-like chemotaxis protein
MSDATQITGRTILIVDDNPVNLGVIVEHLEYRGFDVAVALGGEEALDRADFLKPDLILLDVMMPGIDGFETCRRLKAAPETKAIPVIFMTALGDVSDKTEGFAAGGVDYVSKPFQVGDLLARVGAHIELGAAHARMQREIDRLRAEMEGSDMAVPGSRHRRLFETASDGILLVDCATGTVSDVNPAAAAMLGSEASALLGRRLSELPHFGGAREAAVREVVQARHLALGSWQLDQPDGPIGVDVVGTLRHDEEGELVELNFYPLRESRAA